MRLKLENLKRLVRDAIAESVGRVVFSQDGLKIVSIDRGERYMFQIGGETAIVSAVVAPRIAVALGAR